MMPRSLAPERIGRLDQIAPRGAHGDGDHQDDLEDRADEDDEQLLQFADAGPQDQQRDEGRGRQIASKGDERFEEGFDRLVGAHQHAERHRDDRGEREAADDAPDRHADVEQEAVLGEQVIAFLHHGQRVGEKGLRHMAAERCPRPEGDEQHEEREAVGHALLRCHGIQGTHQRSIRAVNEFPASRREAGPAAARGLT